MKECDIFSPIFLFTCSKKAAQMFYFFIEGYNNDWSILRIVDISVHRLAQFIWAAFKKRAHKREGAGPETAMRFWLVSRWIAMLPSSRLHDLTAEDSCKFRQCSITTPGHSHYLKQHRIELESMQTLFQWSDFMTPASFGKNVVQ